MNKDLGVSGFACSLLVLVLVIGLSGCNDQQKLHTALKEYQQRMATVLDVPAPIMQTVSLGPYPSIKMLKRTIPASNIRLAEFYQLKNCQLATLIAERNTSLGRTQYPSTRYLYEVKLLQAIEQCLDNQNDQQLTDALRNWQVDKQQKLPLVWSNLLQTSSEIKLALSANQGFIQGNEKDGLNQTLAALRYIKQLRVKPNANGAVLEVHLANLQQFQLPARLWRSQRLLSTNLAQTTQWLKQNEALIHCSEGNTSKKVEYLNNVFQLFFIEKIQPVASKINHYHYKLNTIFSDLIQNQLISPALKEELVRNTGHHFDSYKQTMKQHILFWQGLYKRCGLSPAG